LAGEVAGRAAAVGGVHGDVKEVASGQWGVGGQTLTSDDVKALARG
jgi:hypothetical protein